MDTKSNNISLKALLIAIGLGIWVIVLQNAGVITSEQNVYVKGGSINTDINGAVNVHGSVRVDNTVDVDIKKINGWNAANYYEYKIEGKEFHSLGIR